MRPPRDPADVAARKARPTLVAHEVAVAVDDQVLLPETSVSVTPGEAVAIRGRNGAGKTTLLRVLSGMTTPTRGEITLGGDRLTMRDARHRAAIAAMIGAPPFARELTLHEQLRFVAATWGSSARAGESVADDLLDEFDITDLAQRYTHELSSGQTQLFALALSLTRPCDICILDEPEQRLDAARRALVADALRRRLAQGIGVVFATHDAALARAVDARELTVGDVA